MRKRFALAALLAFTFAAMCAEAQMMPAQNSPSTDWNAKGREIVEDMAAGKFAAVEAQYSAAMKSALPSGTLEQTWKQLQSQAGAFQKIVGVKTEPVKEYQRVSVDCQFANAELLVQLVFSQSGEFSGLHFVPAAQWTPPDYANQKLFHEQEVTVVNGKFELPGTLIIPEGKGPFPAVVLVQGSGPQDEDETIGPNKTFKDLAWGLGSRGIAVLRYIKRTKKYGMQSSSDPNALTVDDETVSDARAAVALAASQAGIDPKRVYLLGHSLGAMLAPRIATGDPQIAGIIVMAGTTRPLEQVIVEQLKYIASQPGANSPEMQKQIADAEAAQKQIEGPNLKQGTMIDLLGTKIPSSYWLDLRGYHPAEVAAKLTIPIFVLQGGHDYQVTKPDYDGWQAALAGHSNATLKWYPDLSHLFFSTPAMATPADYDKPGHVDATVINDIAAWVNAGGKMA